jgi:hypothetical protein
MGKLWVLPLMLGFVFVAEARAQTDRHSDVITDVVAAVGRSTNYTEALISPDGRYVAWVAELRRSHACSRIAPPSELACS